MIQSGDDDSSLQFTVKRYTKVMAHHKRQEHRTRRFTVLGNVQGDRKRNSRDSFFFDSALNHEVRFGDHRAGIALVDCFPQTGSQLPGVVREFRHGSMLPSALRNKSASRNRDGPTLPAFGY